MRSAVVLLVVAILMLTADAVIHAQDATQPAVTVPSAAVDQTPSPTPVLPEMSALDQAFNQTALGKDADELQTRIEVRNLQNQISREPQVLAGKAAINAASTDLE
jgi:hypothetical protein